MTTRSTRGPWDTADDDTPPLGFPSPYGPVPPGSATPGTPPWSTAPWGTAPWGSVPPPGGPPPASGAFPSGPYPPGPYPPGPGGASRWAAAPRRRRRPAVLLPLVVVLVTGLLVATAVLLIGQRGTTATAAGAPASPTAAAPASPAAPPAPPAAAPPAAPAAGGGDLAERANRNRVGFAVTRLQSVVRDANRSISLHAGQPVLLREDFRSFARGVEAFATEVRAIPVTGTLRDRIDVQALPATDRAATSLNTIGTSTDRAAILEATGHVDADIDAMISAVQSLREP